ncbi:hypothetical protein V8C86DRAFT_2683128 [Haematococcus lacustris]
MVRYVLQPWVCLPIAVTATGAFSQVYFHHLDLNLAPDLAFGINLVKLLCCWRLPRLVVFTAGRLCVWLVLPIIVDNDIDIVLVVFSQLRLNHGFVAALVSIQWLTL